MRPAVEPSASATVEPTTCDMRRRPGPFAAPCAVESAGVVVTGGAGAGGAGGAAVAGGASTPVDRRSTSDTGGWPTVASVPVPALGGVGYVVVVPPGPVPGRLSV